ncbi:DUF4129 domain-containing protein [Mycobacterium botniense]|uniref:Protein-glutamine gamma-glutamyltransferase-like C-terminal domain-containing protein n=1 Tax=Mycobacterium botniense TaxID=84962 RepID=A0A7I9XS98_9MYCO|nr:DUF4129 domain-containing protein [Mycobacterium botniense]GFG72814.1 hypothetical protein MBOT_01790 [Mycobacterium botniense]
MPGIDKPTGRVVAVIVLLILGAAALHGYLPVSTRIPPRQTAHSAALAFVIALLAGALAIVAISIVARLRDPRSVPPGTAGLSVMLGSPGGRPSWRILLIGLGILVGWLVIVLLLTRSVALHGIAQSAQAPGATAPAPVNTSGTPSPSPTHNQHRTDGDVIGYLGASTVIFLLLLVGATVTAAYQRRQQQRGDTGAGDGHGELVVPPAARSETLLRAAELGLAEIGNLGREPREAIIACYAAMERELAKVPETVPQDFDTPTEVLARAVEHHALHAGNAAQLVSLFEEARFSAHVMSESHRELAVRVLRLVLAELRGVT